MDLGAVPTTESGNPAKYDEQSAPKGREETWGLSPLETKSSVYPSLSLSNIFFPAVKHTSQ